MFGVSRQRVSELRKSLLESMDPRGVVDRAKAAPGTRRKVRSGEFVDEVREIFESTPNQSMRGVAREFGVSDTTVRGAPCHVSNKSLVWLEEHCFDFVPNSRWPPSSPDLNPMDYFFSGYLEAKTNQAPHTTKDSLITAIMEQTTSLSKQVVAKTCKSFRS